MVREDATRGGGTAVEEGAAANPPGAPLRWHEIAAAVAHRRIGRRVVYLRSTGSTNDDAKRLAQGGEPEGTVVLTDEQTMGRGRAGKARWVTPAHTSVALSVVVRPTLRPDELPVLAMMAGVAAVWAVSRLTQLGVALKWPNDVIVGERKLGGILTESVLSGSGAAYAVVGLGLNGNLPASALGAFGEGAARPTTLLEEWGNVVSREALITHVIEGLDQLYAAVREGEWSAVLRPYRAFLATLGQSVRVVGAGYGKDGLVGVAEDVTDTGALVVRLADGERRELAHGEVSVRPV